MAPGVDLVTFEAEVAHEGGAHLAAQVVEEPVLRAGVLPLGGAVVVDHVGGVADPALDRGFQVGAEGNGRGHHREQVDPLRVHAIVAPEVDVVGVPGKVRPALVGDGQQARVGQGRQLPGHRRVVRGVVLFAHVVDREELALQGGAVLPGAQEPQGVVPVLVGFFLETAAETVEIPVLVGGDGGGTGVELAQVIEIRDHVHVQAGDPLADVLVGLAADPVAFLVGVGEFAVTVVVGLGLRVGEVVVEVVGQEHALAVLLERVAELGAGHEAAVGEIARKEGEVGAGREVDEKRCLEVEAVAAGKVQVGEEEAGLPGPLGGQDHDRRVEDRHVLDAEGGVLEEGVAAVGDLRIRGAEAPGRGFARLELAGDDPAVLDVVGEFAGLLDHPPLEMHTLFLSDDGGVLEGAGRLLQVDAARLGAQLVRAEVDEQVAARLHPAEFHVIGQPVGLDAGHGFGLGDGFLRFVGRLL